MAVGQAPVVKHLQQDVEDVGVRLLDFVEQDQRIGPPPHPLGEVAALLVADIARRSADQAGHRVPLHELRHIDPQQGLLAVEQGGGQGLA